MSNEERWQARIAAAMNAGVPLGGVGAGSVEMGRDGRFRNITINNNRTVDLRIPVARGSFLAVRTAVRGRVAVRFLQADSDIPFESAGIAPVFTPVEQMAWRGTYPRADYRFQDPQSPVEIRWTAFSPVIPYDLDAAILPVILFYVDVQNRTEYVSETALVFNWENLCGCTRLQQPTERGEIRILTAPPPEPPPDKQEKTNTPPPIVGMEFGMFESWSDNAHGNYCLLTPFENDVHVSVLSWNETDQEAVRNFWEQFHDNGALNNTIDSNPSAHSTALCCSFALPGGMTRRIVFALSWFCPRFVIGGYDQGNRYAAFFRGAREVAERALKYHTYFFRALERWHGCFQASSLPRWLTRMLINNNYVFSTNTLYTREGKFAMFETPEDPRTGALDRRFHSSIATLLFFPKLAFSELEQFALAAPPNAPGRLYRYLGRLSVHQPELCDEGGELLDLNAKFILMVYRDYHMTGRLADMRKLYPRLKQVMQYILDKDSNGDALPEVKGFRTTYDNWKFYGLDSYSGTIWLAAIRAYAELTRNLGMNQEAEWCEQLLQKAVVNFERRLWNEKGGYYYFHDNAVGETSPDEPAPHGCVSGQLAGQWYADFLGLGVLLPINHIERALNAIFLCHEQGKSIASWPAFHITHYACLEITRGMPERGLHSVEKTYNTLHVRHGRTFNQPLWWDLVNDTSRGWGNDRHMSAPSVWHVLFALQGFVLNVPDQELWLRPHLPTGVHSLDTPLFTPISFGWFRFVERDEQGVYRQHINVSFDSPITINTLVLRVPREVMGVQIQTRGPEGCNRFTHRFGNDGREKLLEIQFESPLNIQEPLQVLLTQTQGAPVRFPNPPKP